MRMYVSYLKKSVIFQQPQQKLEGNFAYISEN